MTRDFDPKKASAAQLDGVADRDASLDSPGSADARAPTAQNVSGSGRSRLESVDLLRGAVMVVMALDHVRVFFFDGGFAPTDLSKTTTAVFLTRWITHFCAPVFVFLAGTAAFLSRSRGKRRSELARFLLTRGLWLVLLELTVVRFAFQLDLNHELFFGQVIWALGWSMIVLSVLVFLPTWAITAIGVTMIATHNLLDGVSANSFGPLAWLFEIVHQPGGGFEALPGVRFEVWYPLVPWIGVMAAGYGFGTLLLLDREQRIKWLVRIGAALTAGFIVLRAINLYGDPDRWSTQPDRVFTVLSFLNTDKYPPSLLFLLMTLGPAIVTLALFDRKPGRLARPMITFGRVPLFYYVLHLLLAHALAVALATAEYGPKTLTGGIPEGFGYGLPVVYAVWLAVVLALYPACRWFANLKARRRDRWLSYL